MTLPPAAALALGLATLPALRAAPDPVGDWGFDDAADLTAATVGKGLVLVGDATAAAGVAPGDGAIEIGPGSHLRCTPDIAPNGGSSRFVNEYTFVFDAYLPESSAGQWRALLQTNSTNSNDGDYFISPGGELGVGEIGYSTQSLVPETWCRIVFSAAVGSGVDGAAPGSSFLTTVTALDGTSWSSGHSHQDLDGRHSLYSTANENAVLLFADENREDGLLRVSRVQLYDRALGADEALALGGPAVPDPDNTPPDPPALVAGGGSAETGAPYEIALAATDEQDDAVVVSVDWGDGTVTTSGGFTAAGSTQNFSHRWSLPGEFEVRARARDEHGASSDWANVRTVTVTGDPVITVLTPPYLQNVRTDGIVVMIETAESVDLEVSYDSGGPRATAPMARVTSGGGTWFHRAALTGLDAGTEYHYSVHAPGDSGHPLHGHGHAHFHTAPDRAVDFKFSAWSDSQGHNRGAWTADPLEPTVSMMKHMVAQGIAFGLTTGDLAENGGSYADTRSYYLDRVAAHLGTSVPWFAAWGNHDTSNPQAPLRLASDMPSRYREADGYSPGHGSFTFTYANCFFVCLDEFYKDEITNGWLEAQLASPGAQGARFRFLGVHVPPFCERWIDGDAFLRAQLVPLLEEYRVDICFSGHTHEYERGELNHVHYLITGGGSWLDHTEEVVRDWEHMVVGGAHDVEGLWAQESSPGVLGAPRPIVGGLFNEYALVSVRDRYLNVATHGFNADGSHIGVLDSFEIGDDPGPDRDGDGLRDAWEETHGLDPDNPDGASGAAGDPDGDGQDNAAEQDAGTDPVDARSAFRILDITPSGDGDRGVVVNWSSVPGRHYLISGSSEPANGWTPLEDEGGRALVIPAAPDADATAHPVALPGPGSWLVRVQVM